MIEVDEDQGDHRCHEGELDDVFETRTVPQKRKKRRGTDRELDRRIPKGDSSFTAPATPPEHDEAEHRYVVVGSNEVLATGAARSRRDDRLPEREPVDHDVGETSPDEAEESRECRQQPGELGGRHSLGKPPSGELLPSSTACVSGFKA